MSKPLVEFDPNKLLKVVGRTVRPGATKPTPAAAQRPAPLSKDDDEGILSSLERMMRIAQQEEQSAACGLDVANLSRCTNWTEEHCPIRSLDCCPRRILAKANSERRHLRAMSLRRGVPERVLLKTFDRDPRPTPALVAVQSFLGTQRSILVLSGNNQCGKSTAAGWAASCHRALGGIDRKTLFVTANEAAGIKRADEIIEISRTLDLLVIDDLGLAYFGASGWALNQLEVLVDTIYRNNAKLIICTDIALKQGDRMPFMESVGKRIASRIAQSGRMEAALGPAYRDE